MNKGATPHASTIRYTVRKGPKGSVNGSTTRNGRTRKPITTPARSASAQSSGAAGFPSRTIVIITLCTLQHLFLALVSYPVAYECGTNPSLLVNLPAYCIVFHYKVPLFQVFGVP